MRTSAQRTYSGHQSFTIEAALWALATAGILAIHMNTVSVEDKFLLMFITAIISITFGVRIFVIHGGGRITPTGLWGASTAMFFGLSGLLTALSQDRRVDPGYVVTALILCTVVQIAVTVLSWRTPDSFRIALPTSDVSNWLSILGAGSLLSLMVAHFALPSYRGFIEHAAFAAIIILATGLIWRAEPRLNSWPTIVILVSVILYIEFFHSSAGRLRVVALVCALGILITMRHPRQWLKSVAVAFSPVGLYLLAQDRLSLQESMGATTENRSGLESMIQPLLGFGRLLQAQQEEGFGLGWGSSLLSYPAALLPDSWLPSQPITLGYELVLLWSPDKYGSGYSVAATAVGEGVYNFGLALGVVAVIVFMTATLRLLDRALLASSQRSYMNAYTVLIFAFLVMTTGAIGDLVWGGQHVFLARTTMRLGLVLVVAAILWLVTSSESRRPTARKFTLHDSTAP